MSSYMKVCYSLLVLTAVCGLSDGRKGRQVYSAKDAFPEYEEPSGKCSLGGIPFRQSCYGFGQVRVSWDTAVDFCKIFGGYLAEISDHAENDFISSELEHRGFATAWVGGSDIYHEGVWQWSTSHLVISRPRNVWAEGQPDNANGHENCLEVHKATGQWADFDCNQRTFFVCEARLRAPIARVSV